MTVDGNQYEEEEHLGTDIHNALIEGVDKEAVVNYFLKWSTVHNKDA